MCLLVRLSTWTTPLIAIVLSFALLGVFFFVRVLFILLAYFFEVVAVIWPYPSLVPARTLLFIITLLLLFLSSIVR